MWNYGVKLIGPFLDDLFLFVAYIKKKKMAIVDYANLNSGHNLLSP